MSPKGAVVFLQILSGMIIALGALGLAAGVASPRLLSIFGAPVPSALVAMMVMGVGAYYWNRAAKLKAKVVSGNAL